jgi:hypothetical protein
MSKTFNAKQGWYKLLNAEKFKKPIDEYMKSYRDGHVNYKSSLELIAIKYADFNKHIVSWSLEPFAIKYIKPSDNKVHRYYIDLFIEFKTGEKFIVEIKPKSQTVPPKPPKKKTQSQKSIINYQNALMVYRINQAKWEAAKEFAELNNMCFIFLTEDELKR